MIFADDALTKNSKSRFKGLFVCDGSKIYKINEDRRTDVKECPHGSIKRETSLNNLPRASSASALPNQLRKTNSLNFRVQA